jgi:hypothetical protein
VADHHDDRSRLEREKTENAGNSRKRKSTDGATTPAGDGVKRAMRQQEEEPEEEEEMDQDLSHISVSICSPAPAPSPTPTTLSTSSLLPTTGGAGTPCLQQQFTSFHSPFISPTQQLDSAPPSPQPVSPFVTDHHDATTRKRGHLGSSAPQASPSPADLNLPQPDHAPAAAKRSRLALDTRKRLDFSHDACEGHHSESAVAQSSSSSASPSASRRGHPTTPTKQSDISRFLVAKKPQQPGSVLGHKKEDGSRQPAASRKPVGVNSVPAPKKSAGESNKGKAPPAIDLLDDTIEVDDDFEIAKPRSSTTTKSTTTTTTTTTSTSSSSLSSRSAPSSAAFISKASRAKERSPVHGPGWIRRIADERKPAAGGRDAKRTRPPVPFLDRSAKSQSSPPELVNARKTHRMRAPDRRAETQIDLIDDDDRDGGSERGESEAQAGDDDQEEEEEEDIDSSWDEENSAALFLEKDLVGDRRIKNRVKKSMKELKPLPPRNSSSSLPGTLANLNKHLNNLLRQPMSFAC